MSDRNEKWFLNRGLVVLHWFDITDLCKTLVEIFADISVPENNKTKTKSSSLFF